MCSALVLYCILYYGQLRAFQNHKKKKKKIIISHNVAHKDHFNKCIISNTTKGFYMQERKMSTIQKLLPIMKEDINFPWDRKCFGSVIKTIRLLWRQEGTKVKV
jgi:hypothetical protein